MTLDIRHCATKIDRIKFDDHRGGIAQVCNIEKGSGDNLDFVPHSGDKVHIKMDAVDDLIAALKKAKELWG